jgi:carbohydrate-selective porin OprB
MSKKILAGLFLTMFSISMASVLYASESEVLLKMLLKKGVITQSEYNEVMGELKGTDSIEKRVQAVEEKTGTLEKVTKEQQQWMHHEDKHIMHAEGPALKNGLSIAAGITMVGQGTSGNDDNPAPGEDVIDGNISADLEISAALGEHGDAFLAFKAGEGAGLEGDEIVSFWGVNAVAGPVSTVELTEAWYEHRFAEDMVSFTIGKLDLTNYYDGNEAANDETTQFLAGGFVNNIAIEFPDNSAAVNLTISPNELIGISVGAQSGDSDWEDITEDPFLIAEVDVRPRFGELQGNYRVYVWTNRTDHTELKDAAKDKESGSGYGISLDQQVTDFLSLFGRIGYQDKKVYEFDIAWSGGVALGGSVWGRDNDVLAIAYGEAILSDDNEDVLKAAGTNPGNEGHLEAYYSLMINEHVTVSPDIQVVTNASGDNDFQTVVIGAVRGQFTF